MWPEIERVKKFQRVLLLQDPATLSILKGIAEFHSRT